MTEQEAREKWCPMARVPMYMGEGMPPETGNRFEDSNIINERCVCIASSCMMWRWDYNEHYNYHDDKNGYCGLGGKP